jgi:hypothetical protein
MTRHPLPVWPGEGPGEVVSGWKRESPILVSPAHAILL